MMVAAKDPALQEGIFFWGLDNSKMVSQHMEGGMESVSKLMIVGDILDSRGKSTQNQELDLTVGSYS